MYAGRVVEQAPTAALFREPRHPYTRGLLGSIPAPGRAAERLTEIPGMVPSLADMPPGCAFAPRCPLAQARCGAAAPALAASGASRSVACFVAAEESAGV
jgi:oligopeptide/dipeptide ABC transporter ATP-binding protein